MGLASKPESESLMRCLHLKLFLKDRKPRRNQMEVLQAYPFSFYSGLLNCLNSDFILSSSHCNFVISGPANDLLCKLLEFCTRVRSWWYYEQDRFSWCWFHFKEVRKSERRRLDCLTSECLFHKAMHSWLKSIRPEDLDQYASLEGSNSGLHLLWEFLFRCIWLHEWLPDAIIFKLHVWDDVWENVHKHRKNLFSVFSCPLG